MVFLTSGCRIRNFARKKKQGLPTRSVAEVPIKKKKCGNCRSLFLGGETACPEASKFETFILHVRLIFKLEPFKPPIGR